MLLAAVGQNPGLTLITIGERGGGAQPPQDSFTVLLDIQVCIGGLEHRESGGRHRHRHGSGSLECRAGQHAPLGRGPRGLWRLDGILFPCLPVSCRPTATSGLIVSSARVFCYGLCVESTTSMPAPFWTGMEQTARCLDTCVRALLRLSWGRQPDAKNPVIVVGPDASNFRLVVSALSLSLRLQLWGRHDTGGPVRIRVQNKTATVSAPGAIGSPCKVLWG